MSGITPFKECKNSFVGEQGNGICFLGFKEWHPGCLSRKGQNSKLSLLLHPFRLSAWRYQGETSSHAEKKSFVPPR